MEVGAEKIFKEIIDEKFPNLTKTVNSESRNSIKPKHVKYEYSYTEAHNNKMFKSNEKEKM